MGCERKIICVLICLLFISTVSAGLSFTMNHSLRRQLKNNAKLIIETTNKKQIYMERLDDCHFLVKELKIFIENRIGVDLNKSPQIDKEI